MEGMRGHGSWRPNGLMSLGGPCRCCRQMVGPMRLV